MKKLCWVLAVVMGVGLSGSAMADQLHLQDGSTLTGQVRSVSPQEAVIQTSFAGELTIARDQIKHIVTDHRVIVQVASGERLAGQLAYDADKGQLLTGTSFGDLKVDLSQVRVVYDPANPPADLAEAVSIAADEQAAAATGSSTAPGAAVVDGGAATSAAEAQAVPTQEAPLPAAFEFATPLYTAVPTTWTGRVEVGVDGSTGNTERLASRARAEIRRTTQNDRLLLYLQGTYAKENATRSANEIILGAELEVDLTERLFAFGKTSLEYDEFESIDMRVLVTGGLGYFIIREDDQYLKVRAGAGYKHETYDDGGTDDTGVLELGVDYMKVISPWFTYTHSTTYYPTLDSLSDFRIVMENAAEIPITNNKDWKFRIGMKNTYDSMPADNRERLDTTYFANLVWDFR